MGWTGGVTHRQQLCWDEWLLAEWNKPSRADYYVMKLIAAWSGGQPEDHRIRFEQPAATAVPDPPPFLVDGKPFGPRKLTAADVARLQVQHTVSQVAMFKPRVPA